MNDVHTWLRYIANGIQIISDMHAVVSTVHALRIQMCSCLVEDGETALSSWQLIVSRHRENMSHLVFPFEQPDAAQCA